MSNDNSNAPRIAFLEHTENGVLTDAAEVTLRDPSGTWGIRESLTETIVVSPGAPTTRVAVGMYEFNIDSLNTQIEYEIFWRVVDSGGNIQYHLGLIPKLTPSGVGSGGDMVPPDLIGDPDRSDPIDCNNDGYADGYSYDLDGDGYNESFDFDNDGSIDAVDYGTVHGPIYGSHYIGPGVDGTGNQVYDPRGVRVGLGGSIAGSGSGVTPPPDGIPDAPSARGEPATDGTFGGMPGYDGLSGFVPATGGARTNREECNVNGTIVGNSGYWDGISFQKLCTTPIGPRGMCLKDKMLAATRVMLKDTDPSCAAFSDDEIDMYLESSLWAFNAKPTFTNFMWDNLQERWSNIIVKGAVVWALYAQSILEAGREFTINDNGISYTPPPVSDKMQSYASALLAHYEKELQDIKQNFKPVPAAVGQFSTVDVSVSLRRLRHLREKRIF
jgi:hypothetical protein